MLIPAVFALLVVQCKTDSTTPWWIDPDRQVLSEVNAVEDHHVYYNSTRVTNSDVLKKEWVNMSAVKDAHVHELLSPDAHHTSAVLNLTFNFSFYGHVLQNVTLTTGGFLYVGEYSLSRFVAMQYIAPLMADFDTSDSNNSFVRYYDNGTAITVQWDKVQLKYRQEVGTFSFQVTLHKNGDIVFAYLQIPIKIDDIEDAYHPVRIGLSDASVIERVEFNTKSFHEYHRLTFSKGDIQNSTVIYLRALPTCSSLKDCASCTTTKISFECGWCERAGRCSDGVDRMRQDWQEKECPSVFRTELKHCPVNVSTASTGSKPPLPSKIGPSSNTPMQNSSGMWWTDPENPDRQLPHEQNVLEDFHIYYNSSQVTSTAAILKEWVNMDTNKEAKVHNMLSNSHRRADKINLTFNFTFYGHIMQDVIVSTGGFLWLGEDSHTWLWAAQYVAPLMANFDTSLSNDSLIRYQDNGTAFTVQWEKVRLKDHPEEGACTFQVTLHQNGDIVFAYLQIPVKISTKLEDIGDEKNPFNIGISDAYVIEMPNLDLNNKTLYEYNRVQFGRGIQNSTVIYLKALPTCSTLKDCASCTTHIIGFACGWCLRTGRCSNGVDRKRQDWQEKECHLINSTELDQCPKPAVTTYTTNPEPPPPTTAASFVEASSQAPTEFGQQSKKSGSYLLATSIAVTILITVLVLAAWTFYALSNRGSNSGRYLNRIQFRRTAIQRTPSTVGFEMGSCES